MVRQSLESSFLTKEASHCEHYSEAEYDEFIEGQMSTERIREFENHCAGCPSCLKALGERTMRIFEQEDRIENEQLLQKTTRLFDRAEAEEHPTASHSGDLPIRNNC